MAVLPKVFKGGELTVPNVFLQYKGVWDMQDLYEFLAAFFSKQKYKFYEKKYILKHPSPFGPETYYVWEAKKQVDEYYEFTVSVYLHTYDTQDIEVTMKDNTKRTFTKGRLWIQLAGIIETDYEGKWDENAFYSNLRNFYHKYVIWKKVLGVYWDNMQYNVVLKLHSLIKERLKMEAESFEQRYVHKVR